MKKTTAIAIIGLMLGHAASAEELTIRWGTEAGYKPFMYKTSDGGLTGFDYDIGNAICAELKATCTWTEQDWDGIIPALQAEKYDAILASMNITDDRKRVVDFSERYYRIPNRFVAREDAPIDENSDLDGVVIGVQRATIQVGYLRAKWPKATIREYPTWDEVWLDLSAGRVDTAMANMIVIQDSFLTTDNGKGFVMQDTNHTDPEHFGEGTGIAVRKGETELAKKISGAIQDLRANGTYAEVNSKYFPFDVYGE
ncbi:transporter substrate-binding domain-containing protein [Rhodobacteraceae bacterium B1Z28]|uniref:Transporter substrate-binding domain-containing protein n=1 Tax=Ruegeria haliotis TaxID=2747601 RepID=A0ABX2PV08_9RHOB|nr:transporter substrate-binding domain-containing protein [Ruegeria haliotis]NVO56972.1 transporter substrate-binding domain-containing protein [Ruegeria haliotis]